MADRFKKLDAKKYRIPKAQILGGLWIDGVAPKRLVNLGDYEDLNLAYDVEETEILANDDTEQVVRAVIQTKRGGTLTFGSRQVAELLRMASYLGTKRTITQAANATATIEDIDDIQVGDVFETEIQDATTAQIVAGDATFTVAGKHLRIADTGDVEVLALPDGYDSADLGDLTITGPAQPITYDEIALLKSSGAELRIKIVQLNEGGDSIVIPKITLRPDGDLVLGTNATEPTAQTFTGKIEADLSQPIERQMGWAVPNRRKAA